MKVAHVFHVYSIWINFVVLLCNGLFKAFSMITTKLAVFCRHLCGEQSANTDWVDERICRLFRIYSLVIKYCSIKFARGGYKGWAGHGTPSGPPRVSPNIYLWIYGEPQRPWKESGAYHRFCLWGTTYIKRSIFVNSPFNA